MPMTADKLAADYPLRWALQELQDHVDDCPICAVHMTGACSERERLLDALQAAREKR